MNRRLAHPGRTYILLGVLLWSNALRGDTPRPLTLAVWDFENASFSGGAELDYLQRALSEMLLTDLAQVPGLKLVERVRLREALEEQKLGSGELASEESRLRLGRIVGANNMVFGSYLTAGEDLRIDVRVVEVETSLTRFTGDTTTSPDRVAEEMHKITRDIATKLGAQTPGKGAAGAEDMAVWKRYEAGIALMDEHKYDQAIAAFKEILKGHPGFEAAEKQIKLALERKVRQ